jgi:hypothetical protein
MLMLALAKDLDGADVALLDIGLGDLSDRLTLLNVIADRNVDRREPAAETASTTRPPPLIKIPSPAARVGIRPTTPHVSAATKARQTTNVRIQSNGLVMPTKWSSCSGDAARCNATARNARCDCSVTPSSSGSGSIRGSACRVCPMLDSAECPQPTPACRAGSYTKANAGQPNWRVDRNPIGEGALRD